MTDKNNIDFITYINNEEKSKEKFREILPTVNYLISTNLNFMKENDKRIDTKLIILKDKVNRKIEKYCQDSFKYLNSNGKLIFNYIDKNDENDIEDEFSLYDFKFENITNQDRPLVNQFISCVTDHSIEENSLIEKMNIRQDEINAEFTNCKKTCVFDKLIIPEIKDNEIIMCLNNCLAEANNKHKLYTEDYLSKLGKFI